MDPICFFSFIIRALARVLKAEEGCNNQHCSKGICRHSGCLDHHAAKPYIDGYARQAPADPRKHNITVLTLDGTQFGKFIEPVCYRAHVRRIYKAKTGDIISRPGNTRGKHLKDDCPQGGALDLGVCEPRT